MFSNIQHWISVPISSWSRWGKNLLICQFLVIRWSLCANGFAVKPECSLVWLCKREVYVHVSGWSHLLYFFHRPDTEKSEEIWQVWNNVGILCTVQFCAVSVAYIVELCRISWSHHALDNIFVIPFGPNLFTPSFFKIQWLQCIWSIIENNLIKINLAQLPVINLISPLVILAPWFFAIVFYFSCLYFLLWALGSILSDCIRPRIMFIAFDCCLVISKYLVEHRLFLAFP